MYRCLLLDPPWLERGGGVIKRGADRHYRLLHTRAMPAAIHSSGLWRPDPAGAHVWLWVTNNFLADGLWLLGALGARYVTVATWAKDRIGLGQYLRGQTEQLLFGVVGRLPSQVRTRSTLIQAKRRGHSQKPEEAYQLIEAVSPGPRAELFARARRPGWDAWGEQLDADPGLFDGIDNDCNDDTASEGLAADGAATGRGATTATTEEP